MGKRTASIAMATVMLLSCLTAIAVTSPDTDASMELDQGDAWGYNEKLDADTAIKAVYDYTEGSTEEQIIAIHTFLGDGKGNALTTEMLIEKIKDLPIPYDIKNLAIEIDLEVAGLMEVVSKDANGYVMEFNNALLASITLDLEVEGFFPTNDDDDFDDGKFPGSKETVILKDVKLSLMSNVSGTMHMDTKMNLIGVTTTSNAAMEISGKTNIELVSEDGDDEDYNIIYHPADKLISENHFIKMTQDAELTFDKPVKLFPDSGKETWGGESNAYIHASSYISSSLPIDIENAYVNVDTDDIEYFGMTIPKIDGIIPEHYLLNLEGISLFYPATTNPVLSADERDSIRGELNKIIGDIDNTTKDKELTVKFLDGDDRVIDKLTKTVKYGSTIDMPAFPSDAAKDDDDDEVFIGWECGDIIWTSDMPIRSNMTFEPEFADRVTDKPTGPGASGSIVWEVDDLDDLDDILDNDLVEYGNTLYIDVKDSNGKVLYSWTLSNKNADLNGTKLIPKIEGGDVPEGKDYITNSADGRSMLYLDFKASGAMPSNTVVNYNVEGKFANGSEVTIYYDNGTSLEYAGTSSVNGGTVDIPLAHCSSYVLFAEAPADGGSNTMLIVAGVIIGLVIVVAVVFFMKKKSTA